MHSLRWVVCVLLGAIFGVQPASGSRVALVIGNADYRHEAVLANPVHDARLIAAVLEGLGFTVRKHENLPRREMELAIAQFERDAAGAQSAVLYFAGHGMQPLFGGVNYLLPVDADVRTDDMLRTDAISANDLVHRLETAPSPAQLRIVILDACRTNRQAGRARSSVRGLSRMDTGNDATLVAFSTSDRSVALDGNGRHSPYAEALAKHLVRAAEMPIRLIFDETAKDVKLTTGDAQRPRTDGDLDSLTRLDGSRVEMWAPGPSSSHAAPADQGATAPSTPSMPAAEKPAVQRALVPGQVFSDCQEGCPQLVVVPPGRMPRRSGVDSNWALGTPIAVGVHEVTFDEWDRCAADGICRANVPDAGWGRGRQPVVNVSWDDAQMFVRWLSARTGKGYRLLTSAEWEYAARGGSDRDFPWGDAAGLDHANCLQCGVAGLSGRRAGPVGKFAANAFGLHDVIGNVWEWVQDCQDESGTNTTGFCAARMVRGGSFKTSAADATLSRARPVAATTRSNQTGFRVARVE